MNSYNLHNAPPGCVYDASSGVAAWNEDTDGVSDGTHQMQVPCLASSPVWTLDRSATMSSCPAGMRAATQEECLGAVGAATASASWADLTGDGWFISDTVGASCDAVRRRASDVPRSPRATPS